MLLIYHNILKIQRGKLDAVGGKTDSATARK